MLCLLIHDTTSYYPYVVYDTEKPHLGGSVEDITSILTAKFSHGQMPWTEWAISKYGPPIQRYTFESVTQLQLNHPELFI